MSVIDGRPAPRVSERLGEIVRVSAATDLAGVTSGEDIAVEVVVNGSVQRLTLAGALAVAAALGTAIDHIRRKNPSLLAEQAPSASEIDLVTHALAWAKILEAEGRTLDNITDSGIERSALLRRLRAGLKALPEPPPTSFGQPWYAVLESDAVHKVATDGKLTTLAELLGTQDASATARNQFLVQLNGCHWKVVKTLEFGARYMVTYQGHETQVFELAKDGEGWTLKKTQR